MTHSVVALCLLLSVVLDVAFAADFSVDLRTGNWTGGGDYLGWEIAPYKPPVRPGMGQDCPWQAVLKMTFDKKERRRAEIKMAFGNSTLFSFNLGDSATNDAWSGDDGTQSNNAEVHAYFDQFVIVGKDRGMVSYGLLYRRPGYLHGNLTMNVMDQFIETVNDAGIVQYDSKELFALSGQRDKQGEKNFDLYLGMNRVIKTNTYRQGSGLCNVEITWFKR